MEIPGHGRHTAWWPRYTVVPGVVGSPMVRRELGTTIGSLSSLPNALEGYCRKNCSHSYPNTKTMKEYERNHERSVLGPSFDSWVSRRMPRASQSTVAASGVPETLAQAGHSPGQFQVTRRSCRVSCSGFVPTHGPCSVLHHSLQRLKPNRIVVRKFLSFTLGTASPIF